MLAGRWPMQQQLSVRPPARPTGELSHEHFSCELSQIKFPATIDLSHANFQLRNVALLRQVREAAVQTLNLSGNELVSLELINRFHQLRVLVACANALQVGGGLVLRLPKLQELDLSSNKLVAVPPLSELPALQVLRLGRNQITRNFVELRNASSTLRELDMSMNKLAWSQGKGEFDDAMQVLNSLKKLRELRLGGNPISDTPGLRYLLIQYTPKLARLDGLEVTEYERRGKVRGAALAFSSVAELVPLEAEREIEMGGELGRGVAAGAATGGGGAGGGRDGEFGSARRGGAAQHCGGVLPGGAMAPAPTALGGAGREGASCLEDASALSATDSGAGVFGVDGRAGGGKAARPWGGEGGDVHLLAPDDSAGRRAGAQAWSSDDESDSGGGDGSGMPEWVRRVVGGEAPSRPGSQAAAGDPHGAASLMKGARRGGGEAGEATRGTNHAGHELQAGSRRQTTARMAQAAARSREEEEREEMYRAERAAFEASESAASALRHGKRAVHSTAGSTAAADASTAAAAAAASPTAAANLSSVTSGLLPPDLAERGGGGAKLDLSADAEAGWGVQERAGREASRLSAALERSQPYGDLETRLSLLEAALDGEAEGSRRQAAGGRLESRLSLLEANVDRRVEIATCPRDTPPFSLPAADTSPPAAVSSASRLATAGSHVSRPHDSAGGQESSGAPPPARPAAPPTSVVDEQMRALEAWRAAQAAQSAPRQPPSPPASGAAEGTLPHATACSLSSELSGASPRTLPCGVGGDASRAPSAAGATRGRRDADPPGEDAKSVSAAAAADGRSRPLARSAPPQRHDDESSVTGSLLSDVGPYVEEHIAAAAAAAAGAVVASETIKWRARTERLESERRQQLMQERALKEKLAEAQSALAASETTLARLRDGAGEAGAMQLVTQRTELLARREALATERDAAEAAEDEVAAARKGVAGLDATLADEEAGVAELDAGLAQAAVWEERASRSEDYCRVLADQLSDAEGQLGRLAAWAREPQRRTAASEAGALEGDVRTAEAELASTRRRRREAAASKAAAMARADAGSGSTTAPPLRCASNGEGGEDGSADPAEVELREMRCQLREMLRMAGVQQATLCAWRELSWQVAWAVLALSARDAADAVATDAASGAARATAEAAAAEAVALSRQQLQCEAGLEDGPQTADWAVAMEQDSFEAAAMAHGAADDGQVAADDGQVAAELGRGRGSVAGGNMFSGGRWRPASAVAVRWRELATREAQQLLRLNEEGARREREWGARRQHWLRYKAAVQEQLRRKARDAARGVQTPLADAASLDREAADAPSDLVEMGRLLESALSTTAERRRERAGFERELGRKRDAAECMRTYFAQLNLERST